MKSMAGKLRIFRRKPSLSISPSSVTSAAAEIEHSAFFPAKSNTYVLTEEEVSQINLLVPRICSSAHHLKHAIQLISAAISTANPPVASLPIPTLIDKLALEPDLSLPMYFLNTLKFSSNPLTTPLAKMFASSFFRNGHPKKALKIFHWVSRPDFPAGVAKDSELYVVLVDGFCRNGMILDALRVLRLMASENLVLGNEVRTCVYRGLLRDARIKEAVELNVLDCGEVWSDAAANTAADVLDRIIANWCE